MFFWCSFSLASKRSKSVKASAVPPANPAITLPSPNRRTFFAVDLRTVFSNVTCPSPAMTTWPSRLTDKMVVPRSMLEGLTGTRLGSLVLDGAGLASPRVSLVVDLLEALPAYLGVSLGCRKARVPKQLLDRTHVGASGEQVSREGVTQSVRRHRAKQASPHRIMRQQAGHAPRTQATAAMAKEERRRIDARPLALEQLRASLQVGLERRRGFAVDRAQSCFRILAERPKQASFAIPVVHRKRAKLADAKAGAVEDLEHRPVAQITRAV